MGVCVSEYSTRIRGSEILGETTNDTAERTVIERRSPVPLTKLFPRTSTEMEVTKTVQIQPFKRFFVYFCV